MKATAVVAMLRANRYMPVVLVRNLKCLHVSLAIVLKPYSAASFGWRVYRRIQLAVVAAAKRTQSRMAILFSPMPLRRLPGLKSSHCCCSSLTALGEEDMPRGPVLSGLMYSSARGGQYRDSNEEEEG